VGVGQHAVYTDRVSDILYLPVSKRLIGAYEFILDLLIDAARDIKVPRVGDSLKARCNVDTVSVNIVTFNDYVAKMDTDPIENPLLPRKRCVTPNHGLLNNDRAADGFDRTIEHRQKAVTGIFDKPSVVLRDRWFNNFAPVPLHPRVRSFFVESHQAAIASYVTSHNGCKAAGRPFRRIAIFAATERIYLTAGVLSVAHSGNLRRLNFYNTPLFVGEQE
jgi:hypothetical protein